MRTAVISGGQDLTMSLERFGGAWLAVGVTTVVGGRWP